MKFSVLLPTKNRLDYLRYAVETVRRQDYDDWEIIVSDNCSEQDIRGFVSSIDEPRITYLRTAAPIPVTDNWNIALNASTGDYVVMLGDDDGLLRGYFTRMIETIRRFDRPELIYSAALFYTYPGVFPQHPDGYVFTHPGTSFALGKVAPELLERAARLDLVREFLNFRMMLNCNMQHSLMSRTLIHRLREKGKVFQSPYPDYYATNSSLLVADTVVVDPRPAVVIGLTPKSFGFFHFNHRGAEGAAFLGGTPAAGAADRLRKIVMPGTDMNTSWLFAAEAVKDNFGSEFDLEVGYHRYRRLQIAHIYRAHYLEGRLPAEDLRSLNAWLRWPEKVMFSVGLKTSLYLLKRLPYPHRQNLPTNLLRRLTDQHFEFAHELRTGEFRNMVELFEQSGQLRPVA
jgi:hypothetical protein